MNYTNEKLVEKLKNADSYVQLICQAALENEIERLEDLHLELISVPFYKHNLKRIAGIEKDLLVMRQFLEELD